jgi:hypothetical protein
MQLLVQLEAMPTGLKVNATRPCGELRIRRLKFGIWPGWLNDFKLNLLVQFEAMSTGLKVNATRPCGTLRIRRLKLGI